MRLSNVVIRPLITEKSFDYVASNRYVFEVALSAKKETIENEIKRIYGVDVIDINTVILPGKKRRVLKTRRFSKSSNRKKAIVKLKDGQTIDVFPKE